MTETFECRACGGRRGELIIDLGLQPLANRLLLPEDLTQPEPRFPLRVFVCPDCWLMQLTDLVPPEQLFREYLYFSSFADWTLRHAREASSRYLKEYALGPSSQVIEIASNDGYLLQYFQQAGIPCLGIEPAVNIARVARAKGIETIEEFFGREVGERLAREGRQADLILANNVFAHAPSNNDFMPGLRVLLKPGGRIILEFPYGVELLEKLEFDTIYHEHVFYFTLTALVPLFQRHGLEVFDVERIPIHGGSLRLFAGHPGAHPRRPAVDALLQEERLKRVPSMQLYQGFADRVRTLKRDLCALLERLKAEGARVAGYGASAKGSTLLNYCGIGAESLEFIADRSTHKRGRLTPGVHVPIVGAEELVSRRPDYALLLTWNFADEILAQQKAYREAGGKFIIPIPDVVVV